LHNSKTGGRKLTLLRISARYESMLMNFLGGWGVTKKAIDYIFGDDPDHDTDSRISK